MRKTKDSTKVTSDDAASSEGPARPSRPNPINRCSDIDLSKLEVSALNTDQQQDIAYVNYMDDKRNSTVKLLVQSDKIKLTSHGIPSLSKPDSKNNFYSDDTKREFIKIPLDPEQPACLRLRKFLEDVDEWAGSAEMKKKLFGKNSNKYMYQSCIKKPQAAEEDDVVDKKKAKNKNEDPDKKKKYPSMDYVKMKFNMEIKENSRTNKTVLRRTDAGSKNSVIVRADTITDIANEIRFLSEVRFIFYFSKIWASKAVPFGATSKLYGAGFKIMTIEYTPGTSMGLNAAEIDFLSEEEEEGEAKPVKKSTSKKAPKLDDEEEVEKKPVKKSKNLISSDNEEEEEEKEEEPVKKSTSKKAPKLDDENVEEEDVDQSDEEIQIKKVSKKGKKSSKDKSSSKSR